MTDIEADPWAWAHEESRSDPLDPVGREVTLVVVCHDSESWWAEFVEGMQALTFAPQHVLAVNAGSTDRTAALLEQARSDGWIDEVRHVPASTFGQALSEAFDGSPPITPWLWLLHDDAVPAPDALERAILRAEQPDEPAAVTPMLLTPRRRGVGSVISELGETVSTAGTVMSAETSGAIDQGQLESRQVLSASTCGLLVRTQDWVDLGGFAEDLPSTVQGLDFGARLTRSGRTLVTEPTSKIRHREASMRGARSDLESDPGIDRRAYGLGFSALLRGRTGSLASTGATSLLASVGLSLGKDFSGVADERAAVTRWRKARSARKHAAARFATLPATPVTSLRPTRRDAVRRLVDDVGARVGEWAATTIGRQHDGGLDQLTGDDFSGSSLDGRARPWSAWLVVSALLLVLTLVSARHLIAWGPLRGPQLLPVADGSTAVLHTYLDPLAGLPEVGGAPWGALIWVASWPLFGGTDGVVSLVVVGCVLLVFALAYYVVASTSGDRALGVLGGLAVGLSSVLVGAGGSGQVGATVTVALLCVFAGLVHRWWFEGQTWGRSARVGLTVGGLLAFTPLMGVFAWLIVVVLTVWRPGHRRSLLAVLAPLLVLVSPWAQTLFHYPGRILTGISPTLAPLEVAPWWNLLLGRPAGGSLPPEWLSITFMGLLWLAALVAAVRRPRTAGWLLAVAAACGLVAVGISRVGVTVPPGTVVVPQATEWVLAMVVALVLSTAAGLGGLADRVREKTFGLRQVGVVVAAVVALLTLLGATAWWVGWGFAPLERREVGAVPPFILNDSERGLTRTLVLEDTGGTVRWAVQEGDLPRLGEAERGLVFGGDQAMTELAESVAQRIVVGSADDQIVPELRTLGVGHVWVRGGADTLRADIANIPGMGTGSIEGDTATWTIPDAGRVQLWADGVGVRVDPAEPVSAGEPGRTLVLSEPQDPRWRVSVGGVPLEVVADAPYPTFEVGASSGALVVDLDHSSSWWIWAQLAGLVLVVVVAIPSLRPEQASSARVGRRGV